MHHLPACASKIVFKHGATNKPFGSVYDRKEPLAADYHYIHFTFSDAKGPCCRVVVGRFCFLFVSIEQITWNWIN